MFSIEEAKTIADEKGFDIVEVSPNTKPPVCRLMDYGKFKYTQNKKDRDARKKTKTSDLKEVKMRPKIGEHDLQVKVKMVRRLLEEGDKVKTSIIFRGREAVHVDSSKEILENIAKQVEDISALEVKPKLEGKNLIMILVPVAKK